MKPTIRDVARLSGVSISTVSRVMNSPERVQKEKRDKVLAVIEELKYSPNALARGLISKQTQTVGVLIPDIANMFTAEIVKGMEDVAHEMGINLILCNTNREQERIVRNLNILKEKQVDGIIFTSKPITHEYYEILRKIHLPIVLASTHSIEYNIPSVKIDDEKAAYDATKYLIEKGHVSIGMISGPTTDSIAGFPRFLGYKQAMKERLDYEDVSDFVEFGTFQFEDGYEAMHRLYEKNPNITAVFCASDEMALGAISYLHEIGVDVPGEVSVIGFDNTKIARMSYPKLTTVAQPMYEIGKQAIEKLKVIIDGKELAETRTYLEHKIVERESVVPYKTEILAN